MSKVEHIFESLKVILLAFVDYLVMSYAHFKNLVGERIIKKNLYLYADESSI